MKRDILVQGNDCLTRENYIDFIEQCYQAWQCIPVKNVDLIIEYQADFEEWFLRNTDKEYIWGMQDDNPSIDETCNYAETQLHVKNYIIARFRDGILKDFCVIK